MVLKLNQCYIKQTKIRIGIVHTLSFLLFCAYTNSM